MCFWAGIMESRFGVVQNMYKTLICVPGSGNIRELTIWNLHIYKNRDQINRSASASRVLKIAGCWDDCIESNQPKKMSEQSRGWSKKVISDNQQHVSVSAQVAHRGLPPLMAQKECWEIPSFTLSSLSLWGPDQKSEAKARSRYSLHFRRQFWNGQIWVTKFPHDEQGG